VVTNIEARERMEEIFTVTESLRAILDADTWRLFLTYDERCNARFAELMIVIARVSFFAGRNFPLEK